MIPADGEKILKNLTAEALGRKGSLRMPWFQYRREINEELDAEPLVSRGGFEGAERTAKPWLE